MQSYEQLGSLIQLAAKGPLDECIHNDATAFSFENSYKMHTQFAIENEILHIHESYFDETIEIEIPKKGDILKNMFIKVTLPAINNEHKKYANNVGYHLIDNVQLLVNGKIVVEYSGLLLYVLNQLQHDENKQEAYNSMLGVQQCNKFVNLSKQSRVLYIHIPLWNEQLFPIGGMYNEKIVCKLDFNNVDHVTQEDTQSSMCRVNMKSTRQKIIVQILGLTTPIETSDKNLHTQIYLDYIQLNEYEKSQIVHNPQKYTFYQYVQQDIVLSDNKQQVEILTTLPVVQLIWMVHNTKDDFESVQLSICKLLLGDSVHDIVHMNEDYFRIIQGFYHNRNMPDEDVFIYSYSFALQPHAKEPNGSVDFTKLKYKILEVAGQNIKNKTLSIFALCINVLETESGYSKLKLYK